uniref:Uncharacterized protein n=1 Tax=Chromera velia CCMP2878 TaxID=1169474 RepID=A0A0G4I577_9ALVE|eukprot:Cvel_1831.t1-p1 / transcript=Cvel_1831.t1 / gene=Cvel_1831 / organism=Chromera_velia_CCMP2878 / gene_product=Golgin subfamily A member 3, putative / transcript_product=Golgin subfamily A member 3, putative / location=Cvel_scaffold67:122895-126518(+) / protein_length=628 / sequence_SO=supercontig / SO=protein_coding / is_pseudo=false
MSRRLSGSQAVKYLGRMGGDLGQMATRLKDLSQKVQLSGSTYWGLSPADKEVLQELPRDEDALLDLERSLENAQKVVDERGEKSKSESSQLSALRAINTKLLSDQKATDATTKAALEKANSQRDIATDLVASFKTDLRKSKKENAELTKALEQKETALKETQENLSHLTFELSRSSTDADSLRARLATVKKQMESIKADDAAEARDVVEREKNFSSQIQKMTAETKSQKQQLKDLTEENAMTASRLSDSQTELNRLQHKTQEDAEGRAVLEATIEKADREKSKLQKEVVELKRKETEEKEEGKVKQKEREEQTARKEEDNLKRQKLNMQAINTAAASAEDRAKAAEAALSEERDEHQREIASKNRQLSSLHSELSSLQAELTSLAAQFHKDHPHTSREPDSLRPPRPVLRRKHHTTPIHPNYTHTKLINDKPNRPLSNEEQQPTVQVTQKVSADTPLPAHASPETHTEQVAAAVPRVPVKKEKEGVESVEEGKEKTESLDSAEAALQNAVGSSGRSDPPPAQEGEGGGDGSSPSAEPLPSVPSVSTPQLDHPSMALHKMIERERGQEGKHRGSENTLKNVSPKQIIPAVTDKSSVDVAEGLVGSEDRGKGGGRLISGPFGKVWAPRGG